MKSFFTSLLMLIVLSTNAQVEISGKVVDEKNKPLSGVNIYIDGSYDGTSSDQDGNFTFKTATTGAQTLILSIISFETLSVPIDIANYSSKVYKMKESVNTLDAVVVTAGTFSAGEKNRVSVLKPLDIVTTAGSNANIIAALQTLPGTQTVGEDGRLFVRGGEADETQTFVDGIRVAQPYSATTANVPTRGRFSPFLFSGMSFSTGGYSAEYGEALSSVLLLNTQDEAQPERTDISFMTVGLGLSNTQNWKNNSITFNTAYINLAPYQAVIPQNVSWNKPYQTLSGEAVYRHSFEKGLFKFYAAFDASQFDINQESINSPTPVRVDLDNNNFYLNASYKQNMSAQWQFFSGLSYGINRNDVLFDQTAIVGTENAIHAKMRLRKSFSERLKLTFGGDYFITRFEENITINPDRFALDLDADIAAVYAETDVYFSKKLAAKAGLRLSHHDLLKETALTPRISMAYKISKFAQLSAAFGNFVQAPRTDYLKYADYLDSEKATHYLMNYEYNKNKRTLRAEIYHKEYSDLVKYNTTTASFDSEYTNKGFGYARGLDVFWRDNSTFKFLEYWVSYSFIDTQRDYRNFTTEATPSFVAKHSLTLVGKYWIDKWKSQLSVTNTFTTGRPYNNPNESQFMAGRTKGYNNLSLSWAYLINQQKILYFSVSNVLATQNVFGYEYANTPNSEGRFDRRAIIPTADQFFFVGFFWTISDNKKDNQLNNL